MRTSHKAKDAAAEKRSYACNTTGHGKAHQPPLPGSPVCAFPVMLLGKAGEGPAVDLMRGGGDDAPGPAAACNGPVPGAEHSDLGDLCDRAGNARSRAVSVPPVSVPARSVTGWPDQGGERGTGHGRARHAQPRGHDGAGHCEMVQRRQRLWFHRGRGRPGRVRAFQCHHRWRLPQPGRRAEAGSGITHGQKGPQAENVRISG